jgi:LEA14-like dessication related protein
VGAGKAVARISIVLAALLLGACATLRQDFKEPGVALVSITPQIRNLFAPEFDIVLHVTNPNRDALEIVGLSYTIHLQGNKVIDGVASELPIIPAYGEADVRLRAVVDLMSGLNLLGDLLGQPDGQVAFELNADIDLGTFYPMVKVNRSGVIALQ